MIRFSRFHRLIRIVTMRLELSVCGVFIRFGMNSLLFAFFTYIALYLADDVRYCHIFGAKY